MDPHACIDLGRRRDSARSSSVQGRFVCQPYFSCLGRSRPDSRHHDLVDLFQCARRAAAQKAFYLTGTSLSGSLSGLLATALRKMDGISEQHGCHGIFPIEGIFTVVLATASCFITPNRPPWVLYLVTSSARVDHERQPTTTDRHQDLPH